MYNSNKYLPFWTRISAAFCFGLRLSASAASFLIDQILIILTVPSVDRKVGVRRQPLGPEPDRLLFLVDDPHRLVKLIAQPSDPRLVKLNHMESWV
jgi:hypothetical protein